jgi:hypothetical protein
MPSPDLPLEDIVAFKQDPETKYKFGKFWYWTRKLASKDTSRRELEEEIEGITIEYEHHLKLLEEEVAYEPLEVLIATPASMLEDLIKFRWGQLAKRFFDIRRARIRAHSDELKLPGAELAYVTKASRLLSRARPK